MAKHHYTVTINGAPESGVTIDYKYGGTACVLTCGNGSSAPCSGSLCPNGSPTADTKDRKMRNKL